jgi:hypothetical protein
MTAHRARLLVWLVFGASYAAIGSLAPFVLLLGWWEAIPAVAAAIYVGDRVAARYADPGPEPVQLTDAVGDGAAAD